MKMAQIRIVRFAMFLFAAAGCASLARADDGCQPLTFVASVNMQIGADGRIYVPAKIDGIAKSMLVDTGGVFTEITQAAVTELKLPERHTRLELIGVAGDTTDRVVRAPFTLGDLHSGGMDFMVMPGVHRFAPDVPDAAGVLAPNLLRAYDLDLDFGGKKLNLVSQDHCDGKVVYWPASAVAVVPVRVNAEGHILVPVKLDGHSLDAILDTGASRTVLNLEKAEGEMGLHPGSAETPARRGPSGFTAYEHRFKSLSLEGIAIGNPEIAIVPDLVRAKTRSPHDSLEGDTRIPDTSVETGLGDMLLGMDILHRLHVYIAYKEQKLYVTPASPLAHRPRRTGPAGEGRVRRSAPS